MALNMNSIMLGSENSKRLADFTGRFSAPPTRTGATKRTAGSVSRRVMAAW